MMIADLYIRVSTDEQADKGYSQRGQEEMLRRYCTMQGIHVRKVIFEDHSAKSFDRPQWKKLLVDLKRNKKQIDLILFTKWDRFSRNAGDAYQMISLLRKLGVEPQAVEQPLDLSIPENKMMLAFYLAAPEVENDRRALNVIYGTRRAKKEGRFCNKAPIGYVNRITETGKKYIAIDPVQGPLMRRAFEQIAQGIFRTESIFKLLKLEGLRGTRNGFWFNIRNPLYYGMIWIRKFRDEEEMIVPGQHEPLISEELFFRVQDIINGRVRCRPTKIEPKEFLFRGFLLCPLCGRKLTGSTSKGRVEYYSYYHCHKPCRFRLHTHTVNKEVTKHISKYIPKPKMEYGFAEAIACQFREQRRDTDGERSRLMAQIKSAEDKLKNARDWLFSERISPEEFAAFKKELTAEIEQTERRLAAMPVDKINLTELIEKGLYNLLSLRDKIDQKDIIGTRTLLGSIFPEKLIISDSGCRTTKVNEAAELIYRLGKGFSGLRKTKKEAKTSLLSWVDPPGLEPGTL